MSLTLKQPAIKNWFHINAEGHVVGRLANRIAHLLQGKHKPTHRRNADDGDYVVVTNAHKLIFSGKKWDLKLYRWHTGWVGGLREVQAKRMLENHPHRIIQKAVKGMLPNHKLRDKQMERLKVYLDEENPHQAQMAQSFHPPHINFYKSLWREDIYTPFDPYVHKGFVGHVIPGKESWDIITERTPGKKAYIRHMKRRLREPNVDIKKKNKWGKVIGFASREKVLVSPKRIEAAEEWRNENEKEWEEIDKLPDFYLRHEAAGKEYFERNAEKVRIEQAEMKLEEEEKKKAKLLEERKKQMKRRKFPLL